MEDKLGPEVSKVKWIGRNGPAPQILLKGGRPEW